MSGLREAVRSFVDLARRRPALASDPAELDGLEKASQEGWDGSWGAQETPMAPYTFEGRVVLQSAQTQSNPILVTFPYPVDIIGLSPVLEPADANGGGLVVPTLNSIDVQINLNQAEQFTASNGLTSATIAAVQDSPFVSLASMGVAQTNGNRKLGLKIRNKSGNRDVNLVFRWKRGAGIYAATIICLSFFVRKLSPDQMT